MRLKAALAIAAALSLAAPAAAEDGELRTSGIASWYGGKFQGRRTANGETFDKEKLTCAHRTLPFGTYLLVRNLDNGSSVVVRVNDRGPFAKDRILDLSEAAARLVGMLATGTARVSFAVIPEEEALAWRGGGLAGAPPPAEPAPAAKRPGAEAVWRIQVASYRDEANAGATVERLRAAGLSPTIEVSGGFRRVVFLGLSEAEARTVAARLDVLGYRGYSIASSRPR